MGISLGSSSGGKRGVPGVGSGAGAHFPREAASIAIMESVWAKVQCQAGPGETSRAPDALALPGACLEMVVSPVCTLDRFHSHYGFLSAGSRQQEPDPWRRGSSSG